MKISFTKKYVQIIISILSVFLFLYVLRVNYHYSPLPTTPSCPCYLYQVTQEDRDFEKILQNIPADASITASIEIRPHISHRELAFTIPSEIDSVDYIALITQNRIVSNYNLKEHENILIPLLLVNKKYELLFKSEHFYLFKKIK